MGRVVMMTVRVRTSPVEGHERFRREDILAMTPSERMMCMFRLLNRRAGPDARPLRGSGIVSFRTLPFGPAAPKPEVRAEP